MSWYYQVSDIEPLAHIREKPATQERFNNTLRQRVGRLVRKTLSFSKKLSNHIGAMQVLRASLQHLSSLLTITSQHYRLANVPQNQASLWTTYEIPRGNLQGFGFGFGLFYVGERQGDLANSFQLGDYLRTDAAVYYRRNGFNAAINIRNLLNIDYVSAASYGDKQSLERGEPFTIIGSISWEL